MVGALNGVRVIDFGQYVAGPLTAMLLADQGAEVIRVDPPSGPAWQTPANAIWNRGKRSIALDLKQDADVEVARGLIASADVVIENFRPGVMARFGLDAARMTEADPRLVYCSLPGFAEDDARAAAPAWEGVVNAASGTYRRNREGEPPGAPVYTALPIASTFAAVQAAIAITMALGVRERDGVGQRIEVPLFDAMFATIGYQGLRLHTPPSARGVGGVGLGGAFRCKDGRWIYFGNGNGNTPEVLEACGATSWVTDGLLDAERVAAEPSLREELLRRARDLFMARDAEEWEAIVSAVGGECAVCRESSEWLQDAGALESQLVIEVDDPVLGRTRQPGIGAWLSRTPGAVRRGAPKLDADRESVLAELGDPSSPERAGGGGVLRAALDGVRVLDLCIVLAGPTCGRTLAEYGADVIKIEAPDRPPSTMFHLDVNRGKRSIVLDLKRPEGLEVFWRLVDGADVVVQNFRNGVAERLGIGYEQVRGRKPGIVYASLNMHGQVGRLAARPGHEQFAQAATGMQARYGGDGAPQLQRLAVTDYGTGYLGAYAVALALLHRQRTGEGQHVGSALAHTATLLQSPFMLDCEGAHWDEPRGQNAIGEGSLQRAYPASDGWFFLGARFDQLRALGDSVGLDGIEVLEREALVAVLQQRFLMGTVDEWVARLTAAGVGASPYVHDIAALMEEPWLVAHGLSVTRTHGERGVMTHTGPAVRMSRTPLQIGRPTPEIGADTAEVLAEVGLGERVTELAGAMVMTGGQADPG